MKMDEVIVSNAGDLVCVFDVEGNFKKRLDRCQFSSKERSDIRQGSRRHGGRLLRRRHVARRQRLDGTGCRHRVVDRTRDQHFDVRLSTGRRSPNPVTSSFRTSAGTAFTSSIRTSDFSDDSESTDRTTGNSSRPNFWPSVPVSEATSSSPTTATLRQGVQSGK